MRLTGGINIQLQGRPSDEVEVAPEPERLHLPLRSRRFDFSLSCVEEGQAVAAGEVLARDPANHSVPLLAPRAGTVRLGTLEGHITLEDVAKEDEAAWDPSHDAPHVPRGLGSAGMKRYKLLELGAWQFLHDAHTGALPCPFGTAGAVIVSTLRLEPFLARGNVQMAKRLSSFTRGLEHIQSLLEYQPIHLVVPDVESEFAAEVRGVLRGYAFVRIVDVPLTYPYDHFAVLARALGLAHNPEEPVWAVHTAGVLAIERALTLSRPSTVRLVSVGGPAAESPRHVKAMPGYPLADILGSALLDEDVRVVNGGVFTGEAVDAATTGLDAECEGLTLLAEHKEREFFSFLRPGGDRQSYSRCFLSALAKPFAERLGTALGGERRACVACGYCEEVCPVGIMPHLIHKYLYQDDLENAERAGAGRCIACGLCSYVCPSKIELREQLVDAQERIREELHAPLEPVEEEVAAQEEEVQA